MGNLTIELLWEDYEDLLWWYVYNWEQHHSQLPTAVWMFFFGKIKANRGCQDIAHNNPKTLVHKIATEVDYEVRQSGERWAAFERRVNYRQDMIKLKKEDIIIRNPGFLDSFVFE